MYRLITLFVAVVLLTSCGNTTEKADAMDEKIPAESKYNAELAEKLGADDYGMKQYVMAFLKKGPNRERTEEDANALQRAHLDNIRRMAEEGKLLLAGPFLDNEDLRGIYIFDVRTVEEAEELTKTDPAIREGQLVMELRPWYGSAALMKVNEIHGTISAQEI